MTKRLSLIALTVFLAGATCASAQTPRTGKLMREKLLHSQRILAALTTSDWTLLQRETLALTKVTQNPIWDELMTAPFQPYAANFAKALSGLAGAADRRDYDAAGASYSALTTACLGCHKQLMNTRIARKP